MTLDQTQQRAVDLLLSTCPPDRPGRLGGYAGTGKTLCIGQAITRATDPSTRPLVLVPTHRARLALKRCGIDAETIHSAIYAPIEARDPYVLQSEITQANLDFDDAKQNYHAPDRDDVLKRLDRKIIELNRELDSDVNFVSREDTLVRGRNLIVDEASMVGGTILEDIQNAGPASIVLVGDPAQLPPVKDKDPFRSETPDVQLEHVYRHDGWILQAATAVREGDEPRAQEIAARRGRLLNRARLSEVQSVRDESTAADYIEICWRRVTRLTRNTEIEDFAHAVDLSTGQPYRTGRTRVCCEASAPSWFQKMDLYQQAWDPFLPGDVPRNGVLGWYGDGVITTDSGRVITFAQERGGHIPIVFARELPTKHTRADLNRRWLWSGGWTLTCHKAQGAQWDRVSVIDEYNRPDDPDGRKRWLYTALTRAVTDLIWWK